MNPLEFHLGMQLFGGISVFWVLVLWFLFSVGLNVGLVVLFPITIADLPEEQDPVNLKGFLFSG